MTRKTNNSKDLALVMVKAIQEKKGEKIKVLDLRKLDNSITDFFVICEAESGIQVNAIFESIDEIVKKEMGEDPFQIEGREEANWILMDYVNVVANIFKPESRKFYALEALWADAKVTTY